MLECVSDDVTPESGPPLGSSPIVTTVFDELLAAVHRGELQPGSRISDAELAEQFGVSRTPVREALQRLRDIGVIEASASRFTRVAVVTPRQTAEALVVWLALYGALIEEVVPVAQDAVAELEEHHRVYLAAIRSLEPTAIATANFEFFNVLPRLSRNAALQRSILGVVHVVRLGSLHLPDYIDFEALGRSQERMIDALRDADLDAARDALTIIGDIEVPQED